MQIQDGAIPLVASYMENRKRDIMQDLALLLLALYVLVHMHLEQELVNVVNPTLFNPLIQY